MKYPCIESTIELEIEGIKIRLWINEKEIKDFYPLNDEYINKIENYFKDEDNLATFTKEKLIDFCVREISRLNAIQIIDSKEGVVVYTVEFTDVKV